MMSYTSGSLQITTDVLSFTSPLTLRTSQVENSNITPQFKTQEENSFMNQSIMLLINQYAANWHPETNFM